MTEREKLSAEIHKCYCRAYERRFGKAYWTGGDYSKLDEETKDYDREMADYLIAREQALLAEIAKPLKDGISGSGLGILSQVDEALSIIAKHGGQRDGD